MLSLSAKAFLLVAGFISSAGIAVAQDLEPRAYAASPVGANFLVVGGGRSSGDVLIDPSLPLEDVQASVNSAFLGAGTTFAFFGRTALFVAAFPYAWVTATGNVGESAREVSRSGFADPRIKLSVNFVGGRALTLREFSNAERPTIVGASFTVVPPLGRYDRSKLVNLGANRWSFKPEVGISHPLGNWTVDGYAGVWLFTANDEFYTGSSLRTQQPIFAFQGHASYTLKPRLWVAFDATWYSGGVTTVDGIEKADLQRSTRVGATLSLPLTSQQSLKFAFSKGATTRVGSDFTTVSAAWQLTRFD